MVYNSFIQCACLVARLTEVINNGGGRSNSPEGGGKGTINFVIDILLFLLSSVHSDACNIHYIKGLTNHFYVIFADLFLPDDQSHRLDKYLFQ